MLSLSLKEPTTDRAQKGGTEKRGQGGSLTEMRPSSPLRGGFEGAVRSLCGSLNSGANEVLGPARAAWGAWSTRAQLLWVRPQTLLSSAGNSLWHPAGARFTSSLAGALLPPQDPGGRITRMCLCPVQTECCKRRGEKRGSFDDRDYIEKICYPIKNMQTEFYNLLS